MQDDTRLVTGSGDSELRVWSLHDPQPVSKQVKSTSTCLFYPSHFGQGASFFFTNNPFCPGGRFYIIHYIQGLKTSSRSKYHEFL